MYQHLGLQIDIICYDRMKNYTINPPQRNAANSWQ